MKKLAMLFVALIMLMSLALPVFAQEDEPLTWQEQYWALFWQVVSTRRENEVYHLVLADLNQDGVQELVVVFGFGATFRSTLVLLAAMDGDTARAFELQSEWGATLIAFDSIWVDTQHDEIRLFGFDTGRNFRFYDEILLCWETYTATSRQLEGVRLVHTWHSELIERNHRRMYTTHHLRSGWRRLHHLEMNWIGRAREDRVPVVAMSYDITRAAFFGALDILAPDGTLYAEPFTSAVPATDFMQTSRFWAWWHRSSTRDWWNLFYSVPFLLIGYFCGRSSKQKQQEKRQQAPMTAIACVDRHWAIGNENQLLFHIPDDLTHFKCTTVNCVLLMGRKTYLSLPKMLPGRKIVVLSRDPKARLWQGAYACRTLEEAVVKAKSLGKVFVAGGGEIYNALLPQCSTAIITQVDAVAEQADTFFLDLDIHPDWTLTKTGEWRTHEGLKWRICEYTRRV